MKPEKPTRTPGDEGNQGEGDRISARRYDRHVREFVARGKVEQAAKDAGAYVERLPDDAERAERRARRGPHPTKVTLEELVAKGRTVIERVRSIAHRITGRLVHRPVHRSEHR